MKVIKLPEGAVQWPIGTEADWIGRNGYFASIGLVVQSWKNGRVALHPVGTRGIIGNCMIEIPKAAIPDVIAALCKALTFSPEKEIASSLKADGDTSTPALVAMGQGDSRLIIDDPEAMTEFHRTAAMQAQHPPTILRMDADFMKDIERM